MTFGDARLPERFWSRVTQEPTTGCWLWTGRLLHHGYGQTRLSPLTTRYAHRVAFVQLVGEVPLGLELDHLCRVRNCVNPAHLEPVTRRENILRSALPALLGARNASKTHCAHGHLFDDANTFRWRGERHCRACDRERQRRYWHERKAGLR